MSDIEFAVPQIVRHKPSGELLITRSRHMATDQYPAYYRCSPLNGHSTIGYQDDDLEPAPTRESGVFDYEIDIVPRANGVFDWEHVEPARLDLTLGNVAACSGWVAMPGIGWVRKPGHKSKDWARIFLHTTQGGKFTGQAHALVWERGPNQYPKHLRDAVVRAAVEATHNRNAPPGDLAAAVLDMEATREFQKEGALPSAWLLSICKHEVIDSSTPSGRMRGWHPARCSKCGINLSVDSSD